MMNMQGLISTKSEKSLKTIISAFTERQINIEMVIGDNSF